jgi:hypothetical protein
MSQYVNDINLSHIDFTQKMYLLNKMVRIMSSQGTEQLYESRAVFCFVYLFSTIQQTGETDTHDHQRPIFDIVKYYIKLNFFTSSSAYLLCV